MMNNEMTPAESNTPTPERQGMMVLILQIPKELL